MSVQQNKPMSREEREKLLEDARQKGVLNPLERETLAQKLDADFDAFLKEQLKASNSNDTQNAPAMEKDIENLAEVSVLFFHFLLQTRNWNLHKEISVRYSVHNGWRTHSARHHWHNGKQRRAEFRGINYGRYQLLKNLNTVSGIKKSSSFYDRNRHDQTT